MLIYNPPHGKSIRVPKTFAIRAIRVQRKNSIRVPKTYVRFVFKERNLSVCQKHSCYSSYSCSKKEFYPCAKNIRAIRAIRVQRKNSIRVPKTFVTFERFVFKERIRVHLQSVGE